MFYLTLILIFYNVLILGSFLGVWKRVLNKLNIIEKE